MKAKTNEQIIGQVRFNNKNRLDIQIPRIKGNDFLFWIKNKTRYMSNWLQLFIENHPFIKGDFVMVNIEKSSLDKNTNSFEPYESSLTTFESSFTKDTAKLSLLAEIRWDLFYYNSTKEENLMELAYIPKKPKKMFKFIDLLVDYSRLGYINVKMFHKFKHKQIVKIKIEKIDKKKLMFLHKKKFSGG